MLDLIALIVAIIGTAVTAIVGVITYRRYRQEVPRKRLSYYATALNPNKSTYRIHISNSGNQVIEAADWVSAKVGFDFGRNALIRKVNMEEQVPRDLGLQTHIE